MTLEWVLAAMTLLAPGRDHSELAFAVYDVVEEERPLFADDEDKTRTAALVVAVAYREGSLQPRIVGDHGRSFCTMQVHSSSGGSPALLEDVHACVRKGLAMLRTSLRVCREFPIAWYASGVAGCTNARAQRISRDRMALAARLVREVQP